MLFLCPEIADHHLNNKKKSVLQVEINIFILHHPPCALVPESAQFFGDEREDLLLPLLSVQFTGSNQSKSPIRIVAKCGSIDDGLSGLFLSANLLLGHPTC